MVKLHLFHYFIPVYSRCAFYLSLNEKMQRQLKKQDKITITVFSIRHNNNYLLPYHQISMKQKFWYGGNYNNY